MWLWCFPSGLCHVHLLESLYEPKVYVSTKLLKVAYSRSLRPLSFLSTLQYGPQTFPKSACTSFPTLAFQFPCTTGMSFFGVWSMVTWSAGRSGRPHCHHVQMLLMVILKGAALKQIEISLLETGQNPKAALTLSLCTRNPTPCSCQSFSSLK